VPIPIETIITIIGIISGIKGTLINIITPIEMVKVTPK
jgi:hypothetical protein